MARPRTPEQVRIRYSKLMNSAQDPASSPMEKASATRAAERLRERYPEAFLSVDGAAEAEAFDWRSALDIFTSKAATFVDGALHVMNGDTLADDTVEVSGQVHGNGIHMGLAVDKSGINRIRRLDPDQLRIYCDAVGQDYEECESDYCDFFEKV